MKTGEGRHFTAGPLSYQMFCRDCFTINNIIGLLVCALSVYAAGVAPAEAKAVIQETDAGCPAELASVEPLLITAAYPDAVTAKNPSIPSIRQTGLGGIDVGQPGDKAVFLLSKMKTGKGYYRSNDSITVTLDTSGLTSDVWFEFDHITSKYGSRKMTVYLDGETLLGQFDCNAKPHYQHRRVAGRLPQSLLTGDRHRITFVEANRTNYATIDSIQLRGKGLRIISSEDRSLSAAELNTEQLVRTSHLPNEMTMPTGWRGFDFSTPQSSVWKRGGCVGVTPDTVYQAKSHFGWVPHETAITAGTIAGGDALRGDYNACRAREKGKKGTLCEFRVDLPNDRYNMMVIAGLAPFTKKIQRKNNLTVADLNINDQHILSWTYFTRQDGLLAEQSVHHRFVSAEVTNGQLSLKWVDNNYAIINGLFIWPAESDQIGHEAAIQIMEDYYLPLAVEIKPGETGKVATDTATRKKLKTTENRLESTTDTSKTLPIEISLPTQPVWQQQGFVVFQREYDRTIYPYSVPTVSDRVDGAFWAAAAKGESEPWQLGLHALRDLDNLSIDVSALKRQGSNEMIGSEYIDVRQGYVLKASLTTRQGGQYLQIAKPLVGVAPKNLSQGQTRLFWITVHVPDNAKQGTYLASATVMSQGQRSRSFDLELTVRPFALQKSSQYAQGFWWYPGYFYIDTEQQTESQIADMAKHGMQTAVFYNQEGAPEVTIKGENISFDYSRVDRILSMFKKYGFTGPFPVYSPQSPVKRALPEGTGLDSELGRKAIAAMFRGMIDKYREYDYEVYFYPYDEPHASGPSFEAARDILKIIKETVPEAKTFCTVGLSAATTLDEWLDGRIYQGMKKGWVQAAHDANDIPWEYGGIYSIAPNRRLRIKGGLANVRSGVGCKLYWTYCATKGNAYFELDSDQKDCGAVRPSADGPIPIVGYECLREGIDDINYFHTLRTLAEQKNDAGAKALVQQTLDMMDEIGTFKDKDVSLSKLRETMAACIAALARQEHVTALKR